MIAIQHKDQVAFNNSVMPLSLLEDAIEWIVDHYAPEFIYPEKDMEQWASENGYVKGESS
jgi:hypothetical protein